MEPQQQKQELQQQQQHQTQQGSVEDNSGGGKGGSFLCRQSSTRWTPTTDQIRILKDLYYNNGVRSPNAEQIQKISARLRQYGKIEGKNVFYWFQNHKARERQKKRFTTDVSMQHPQQRTLPNCKREDYTFNHNKYLTTTPNNIVSPSAGFSSASPSSAGMLSVGQIGSHGPFTMEKSFRECSISAGPNSSVVGGSMAGSYNYGSVAGIDPYSTSSCTLFDKRKSIFNEIKLVEDHEEEDDQQEEEDPEEEEEEDQEAAPEIETLPLFPMHKEEHINPFCNIMQNQYPNNCYYRNSSSSSSSWYGYGGSGDGNGTSRTSLELSLNSYASQTQDFL